MPKNWPSSILKLQSMWSLWQHYTPNFYEYSKHCNFASNHSGKTHGTVKTVPKTSPLADHQLTLSISQASLPALVDGKCHYPAYL
jgi:hypothetical protein